MVVQILVAQRQRHHTLRHQLLDRVLHQLRVPMVPETPRRPLAHAQPRLHPMQQPRSFAPERTVYWVVTTYWFRSISSRSMSRP